MLILSFSLNAQEEKWVSDYAGENSACFKCHGQKTYVYFNDVIGREVKDRMNPYFVLDSSEFYVSNHRNFSCTDCHSPDYKTFPHPGTLRFEPKLICMDCHAGDENYAQYKFETIDEEFLKSVHSQKHNEDFTCWMCHNPHSYKINARNNQILLETIRYDNEICLGCHSNESRLELLSDRKIFDMLNKHEWLPNHRLHFQNVRCIECHARVNDSILVPHNIQTKDKAVKLCVECHSRDSHLMASLYKYQSKERRNNLGFFNAAILTESYVIGANRNYFLNAFSLIIFGLVITGIITHAILRKTSKK